MVDTKPLQPNVKDRSKANKTKRPKQARGKGRGSSRAGARQQGGKNHNR